MNKQAHEELSADLIDLASDIEAVYALPTVAMNYLCDPDDQRIVRLVTGLLVRILNRMARGLDLVVLPPDETPDGMFISAEHADLMHLLAALGNSEEPDEIGRIKDTLVECLGGTRAEFVGDLCDRLMLIGGLVADFGYTVGFQISQTDEHSL